MAGESERCRSLKEALFEALASVLCNEHGIRAAGEEQMKTLEVTEGNFSKLPAGASMHAFTVKRHFERIVSYFLISYFALTGIIKEMNL